MVDALGAMKMTPRLRELMKGAGVKLSPLSPAPPDGHRPAQQAHPPQARGLRRQDGLHLRPRRGAPVDGQRRGQASTGATPASASHGPVVNAVQAVFAQHWIEETGEVLVGEKYFPAIELQAGAEDARPRRRSARRRLRPRADVQDGARRRPEGDADPEPLLHRRRGDDRPCSSARSSAGSTSRSWCPARSPTARSSTTPATATSARC